MITNERGQELHCRSVQNQPLTSEERAELEAWYAKMDAEEAKILSVAPSSNVEQIAELRQKIDEMLSKISIAAERLRKLDRDNETLRQEIAVLEQRASRKFAMSQS